MPVPKLRSANRGNSPGLTLERSYWDHGQRVVVGVDEVGRGSWAGPLTVGAVVVPEDHRIYKVRDSKMLTEAEREGIYERITDWARAWGVGHASAEECDQLGMSDAQRLAARRAIAALDITPDQVIVDGNWDFVGGAHKVVGGDRISLSVAAASIIAKVTRDRMMRIQSQHYPAYNFEGNKGYPCPVHKAALQGWGPSAIHRRSWVFMDHLVWSGVERYRRPGQQLDLGI